MLAYTLVKYLHLLGIMVLFAAIVAEHLLLKREMNGSELRRMARIDGLYGASAVVVLLAGLALWLMVGKPAGFYSVNPIFHTKITLFAVAALLSIYPTVWFARHRRVASPAVTVPRRIVHLMRAQLALLVLIPLLAVLMAQGYGVG